MRKLFNSKTGNVRRRVLRRNMTKAETVLWSVLKNDALGFRFRRQYGIGPYFADFYCPKLKLVIEVDGPSHFLAEENEEHDRKRTVFLRQQGITVLRCTNTDVYENLQGVVERILLTIETVRNSLPPRSARSTPS